MVCVSTLHSSFACMSIAGGTTLELLAYEPIRYVRLSVCNDWPAGPATGIKNSHSWSLHSFSSEPMTGAAIKQVTACDVEHLILFVTPTLKRCATTQTMAWLVSTLMRKLLHLNHLPSSIARIMKTPGQAYHDNDKSETEVNVGRYTPTNISSPVGS